MVWVFYYIQGEEGDDAMHPNAFQVKPIANGKDPTLKDVQSQFPIKNYGSYHFRFRTSGKG
jgi:hypothetical protein